MSSPFPRRNPAPSIGACLSLSPPIAASLSAPIPWDVIAIILRNADIPTLKTLSLVSQDFLLESALSLFGQVPFRIILTSPLSASSATALVLSGAKLLRSHSRLRYIKRIQVRLGVSLGREHVGPCLETLFRAIQAATSLESLELDVLHHHLAVACTMREIPLGRVRAGLAHLHLTSPGPLFPLLRDEFWRTHTQNLKELTLLTSPPPVGTGNEPGFEPIVFPALEKLHVWEPALLRYLALPLSHTLKCMVIDEVRSSDIEDLRKALLPPRSGSESGSPSHHSLVADPYRPHRSTQSVLARLDAPHVSGSLRTSDSTLFESSSSIEYFSFGFTSPSAVPDPSPVYTEVISLMPRLRFLEARHCPFPPSTFSSFEDLEPEDSGLKRAGRAVAAACPSLERYDLIVPSYLPLFVWAPLDTVRRRGPLLPQFLPSTSSLAQQQQLTPEAIESWASCSSLASRAMSIAEAFTGCPLLSTVIMSHDALGSSSSSSPSAALDWNSIGIPGLRAHGGEEQPAPGRASTAEIAHIRRILPPSPSFSSSSSRSETRSKNSAAGHWFQSA